ncbi:ESX secretion-associated protein EspG [Amycolatopsis sp. cg5]|uniref:ESX secretion-associated protein EspG n=1 Tax=Amycolatopsis sp. cg5 TaxID=3238802 RepID=UPI0035269A5D
MAVIDRPVRIPKLAFHLIWDLADLGEPHPVVGTNNYYMTSEFQAEMEVRALGRLAQLGLASDGLVDRRLNGTLRAIAECDSQFYAWSTFHDRDDSGAILLAAAGPDAVRLITDHEIVQLEPISPSRLAEQFVATLPDVPGAGIRPMAVSRAAYGPRDFDAQDPLAEARVSGSAEYLRELMRAERDAVHQLYVAVRDRAGARRRSLPLSAIDLADEGRVLTYLTDSDDGEEEINLVSGTSRKLVAVLEATVDGL